MVKNGLFLVTVTIQQKISSKALTVFCCPLLYISPSQKCYSFPGKSVRFKVHYFHILGRVPQLSDVNGCHYDGVT